MDGAIAMSERKHAMYVRECRLLRRQHRRALKLRGLGYTLAGIARQMKLTEDDVWELLREVPC